MKQYVLTTGAGKRLIGKALVSHPKILTVLKNGTLVIIAGTTNGYAAEEILASIDQAKDFDSRRFFRGITIPLPCRQPMKAGCRTSPVSPEMWSLSRANGRRDRPYSMWLTDLSKAT